jgi:DNA-binding HxlR family transcriptional regulator
MYCKLGRFAAPTCTVESALDPLGKLWTKLIMIARLLSSENLQIKADGS